MDVRKQKICQCSNNETISASESYEDVLKYLESKNCCNGNTCNFECTSKSRNGLCLILPKKQEQNLYKRLILLPAHILYQYTVINALPYGVGILNRSLREYESTARNRLLDKNYIIEPDWDCLD